MDILVNNAGIYEFQPLEAVTPESFHRQYDLNVLGLTLATHRKLWPSAPREGIDQHQFACGILAPAECCVLQRHQGGGGRDHEVAGTRARREENPRELDQPAWFRTEGVHAAGFAESDFRKMIEAQTPLGRIGQPVDIAPAAVFFASDDSSWITGETLVISGGMR